MALLLPKRGNVQHVRLRRVNFFIRIYVSQTFCSRQMKATIILMIILAINCGRAETNAATSSYLLPHYLVKSECSIVQLFIITAIVYILSVKR